MRFKIILDGWYINISEKRFDILKKWAEILPENTKVRIYDKGEFLKVLEIGDII